MLSLFTRTAVKLSLAFALIAALGCGNNDSDSGGGDDGVTGANRPRNRLNWSAISSEYNPKIEDIEFNTDGFKSLNINMFGFNDDVEVVYSKDIPDGHGYLRIFKVWKKQASWGSVNSRADGDALHINNYGSYQCSISIRNGRIAGLEGGCYVRLQVFLPKGLELEVYNVGQLISKRFFAMDTDTFLKRYDDTSFDDRKLALIEEFLTSYKATGKKPSMTAAQLGEVIYDLTRSESKFTALRRLHPAVTDRENLRAMIEEKFNYFDREEARKIAGVQ